MQAGSEQLFSTTAHRFAKAQNDRALLRGNGENTGEEKEYHQPHHQNLDDDKAAPQRVRKRARTHLFDDGGIWLPGRRRRSCARGDLLGRSRRFVPHFIEIAHDFLDSARRSITPSQKESDWVAVCCFVSERSCWCFRLRAG